MPRQNVEQFLEYVGRNEEVRDVVTGDRSKMVSFLAGNFDRWEWQDASRSHDFCFALGGQEIWFGADELWTIIISSGDINFEAFERAVLAEIGSQREYK